MLKVDRSSSSSSSSTVTPVDSQYWAIKALPSSPDPATCDLDDLEDPAGWINTRREEKRREEERRGIKWTFLILGCFHPLLARSMSSLTYYRTESLKPTTTWGCPSPLLLLLGRNHANPPTRALVVCNSVSSSRRRRKLLLILLFGSMGSKLKPWFMYLLPRKN